MILILSMSCFIICISVTHLSNQDYDICFRRNSGNCAVCFTPTIDTDPKSFGVRYIYGYILDVAYLKITNQNLKLISFFQS